MLDRLTAVRLAQNHSPLRERREIFFAGSTGSNPGKPEKDPQNVPAAVPEKQPVDAVPMKQEEMKDRIIDIMHPTAADARYINSGRVQRDIDAIRTDIHTKLDAVVGTILSMPTVTEHTAAQYLMPEISGEKKVLSLVDVVQKKRTDIESLLEQRLERISTGNTAGELQAIRTKVMKDINKLVEFSWQMRKIENDITIEFMQPGVEPDWVKKLPEENKPKKLRGYFDRTTNTIFIDPSLSEQERRDVLQHEKGHAILFAVEQYLEPLLYKGFYQDQDRYESFLAHLSHVSDESVYRGKVGKELHEALAHRYLLYRTKPEELAPGAVGGNTTNHEEAIFALLDRSPTLKSQEMLHAFAAEIEGSAPASYFQNPSEVGRILDSIGSDPALKEQYEWCGGRRALIIGKLLVRHEKARSGIQMPLPLSKTEKSLSSLLQDAKDRYVMKSVMSEMQRIRERSEHTALIQKMLLSLSTGNNISERYRLYGTDTLALWEELLNRHADYRAGRDLGTFTHLEEICMFYLLDKTITLPPQFTQAQIEERIQQAQGYIAKEAEESGGPEGIRASGGTADSTHQEEEVTDTQKEKAEERIDGHTLAHIFGDVKKKMHSGMEDLAKVRELVAIYGDPKSKDELTKIAHHNSEELAKGLVVLQDWGRAAELIEDWEQGKIDPNTFIEKAEVFATGDNSFESLIELAKLNCPQDQWLAANKDAKINMAKSIGGQEILKGMEKKVANWESSLDKINKYAEELEKHHIATEKRKGISTFSLEIYSINHFIESIQTVFESYKKAWGQWTQLKVSKLSKNIGDMVATVGGSYSERAQITLEMDLDHKNDETKDEFKKHLEHDLADFDHCINPHHGILLATRKDPNRFRGTLEYMASKGWLYDLDTENRIVFGDYNLEIGVNLPANWTPKRRDEYLRDLEQQQSKGESSEIDRGKSRVNNYPDIPPMMEVLYDEMKRYNYWAIFGIVERAIEKGKTGETSAWLCTIIMDFLKHDEKAKMYFPKGLMDKLGNIGIVSPVWLTTFFKLDRHDLAAYQKGKLPFEEAGTLAKTISLVEKDVIAAQAESGKFPFSQPQLNRVVAKILASQTVGEEEGWNRKISIYNDRYNAYRNKIAATKTSIKPSDADDDFYNAHGNGGSEVVLMGINGFQTICGITTTGDLTNDVKAKYFLEQLSYRYDKLNLPGLEKELANFIQETQQKMHTVVVGTWTHANNNKLMELQYLNDKNKKIIMELVKRKLITEDTVRSSVQKKFPFGVALWKEMYREGIVSTDITATPAS